MSEVKLPEINNNRGASRGAVSNNGGVKRQGSFASMQQPVKSVFNAAKERKE